MPQSRDIRAKTLGGCRSMTTPPTPPPNPSGPPAPQGGFGPYGPYGPYGSYGPGPAGQFGPPHDQRPYAQHQQPYWPAPPPPRKRRTGAVIAGAAAVAALLAAISIGGYLALRGAHGHDVSAPRPTATPSASASAGGAGRHAHLPASLLDGDYRLDQDYSSKLDDGTGGVYRSATRLDSIVTLWLPGAGLDADQVRDELLTAAASSDGAKVVIPPRRITPPGKPPLTCEGLVYPKIGTGHPLALCAWADAGSGGSVEETQPAKHAGYPYSLDLAAYAVLADRVRADIGG
jgi:hypothetical protein